ncbi:ABC transporter ATP-binding protein [Aestuariibacter salexigens]|uniref:ABC transporter ATP-binding protein n=1 Tax=Aestuariibacter salexigens TaxID=226010 RepID=UPI00047D627D|nr:ABC transporter ATP-binding protein [Aestuariibacter salexigens]
MIELIGVTKYYPSKLGRQYVFDDLNFTIPEGHNIALLGSNGAGKSTLFRMLAKSEYPDKGRIRTKKTVSWPLSLTSGVHPQMTGRENTRFIGRVNGIRNLTAYENRVQEFAELGSKYDLEVRQYSSGMRARLAFACCISIDFDIYLIDELTAVGDAVFKRKTQQALLEISRNANVIMVSHEMKEIRQYCDSAITIKNQQLDFYQDLEHAISIYQR